MNPTEKGGVALHFFASDRSLRYYMGALPFGVFLISSIIIINLRRSVHEGAVGGSVDTSGFIPEETWGCRVPTGLRYTVIETTKPP